MVPGIVLLGLFALGAGLVYLRSRQKANDVDPNGISIPTLQGKPQLPWWMDPYDYPVPNEQTQVYYYPYDQIPDILQEPQPVTWFDEFYGCPPGYSVDNYYNVAGGPEVPGYPGMPNKALICRQTAPFMRADTLRYPLSVYELGGPAGNSSAFHQWYTRYNVLSNYMAGMKNTMNWRSLDAPYAIDITQLTRGGTGKLPNPIQYPVYL